MLEHADRQGSHKDRDKETQRQDNRDRGDREETDGGWRMRCDAMRYGMPSTEGCSHASLAYLGVSTAHSAHPLADVDTYVQQEEQTSKACNDRQDRPL